MANQLSSILTGLVREHKATESKEVVIAAMVSFLLDNFSITCHEANLISLTAYAQA